MLFYINKKIILGILFFVGFSSIIPLAAFGQSAVGPYLSAVFSTSGMSVGGSYQASVIATNTTGATCQDANLSVSLDKNSAEKNNVTVFFEDSSIQKNTDLTSNTTIFTKNKQNWLPGETESIILKVEPTVPGATFQINGSVSCKTASSGIVSTKASNSVPIFATSSGCNNDCVLGRGRCNGNSYQICVFNGSCHKWGPLNPCGNNQACKGDGSCELIPTINHVPSCSNQCSAGQGQCVGNSYQNCIYNGSCYEWGPLYACVNNQTCQGDGNCTSFYQSQPTNISAPSCSNQCTVGNRRCNGNSYQICYNNSFCNIWTTPINCNQNQVCQNGNCVAYSTPPAPNYPSATGTIPPIS